MQTFSGNLVGLRALEPEDLSILYTWENNPNIWQLGQTLKPFSRDILKKYLETAHQDIYESKQIRFVIYKLHTPIEPLGFIDLFDFDPFHQRAGIGILIGELEKRKQGYAFEALQLLCKYAFEILQLNQLYCTIPESNIASIKLFNKAAFQQTGIRKDWIKIKSGWENELFFQLGTHAWEFKAE